jgi:hypothetical protein
LWGNSPGPTFSPENNMVEYTNTQQDLTVQNSIKLPQDMPGFWLVVLLYQKVTKIIDPYF